jgi:hypothetical protein
LGEQWSSSVPIVVGFLDDEADVKPGAFACAISSIVR